MKNLLLMKRRKTYIIFLFSIINFINIHSQTVLDYAAAMPDIGSITQITKMPVDLHRGLPNIDIPIYEIKIRDFSLPMYISYNAGGNKPDLYPGNTGLGWNFYAGGQIYRIINGYQDHDKEVNTYTEYLSRVQIQDWDKKENLSKYYEPVTTNKDLRKEPNLDEFVINIGSIQGSFYIYRNSQGEIETKISSKSNTSFQVKDIQIKTFEKILTHSEDFHGNTFREYLIFFNDIVKFTIVDFNGIEYTFGGDDLNYFDYSCSLDIQGYNYNRYATTSAWKINSIKNSYGDKIEFKYSKGNNFFDSYITTAQAYDYYISSKNVLGQEINYTTKASSAEIENDPTGAQEKGYSESNVYTSYLASISTSRGDSIKFDLSGRNDLFGTIYNKYPSNRLKKIDKIDINGDKFVKFEYIDKPEQRLRLLSLSFYDNNDKNVYKYKFEYNPLILPHYNSRQTDNWGYYNGKSYQELIKYDKHDELYNFRQSDTIKAKAEILQKIIYPTGGEINFDYESHTYSKIAKKYPFNIIQENGITGGLRLKSVKIIDPIDLSKNIEKKYYYLNEDNSSSGILSHIPKYTARGNGTIDTYLGSTHIKGDFSYVYKSENYINWLADNHIAYSRVIEELSDGSKTIYKYSNFDTDNDEEACGIFSPELSDDLHFFYTSNELSRGLLKELSIYDSTNNLKRKIYYTYNVDKSDYLKVINRYAFANNIPIRITANKIYTFYPYLQGEKVIDYHKNGIVTNFKEYIYNKKRLLHSKIVTTNDGSQYIINYKYPFDFSDIEPYNYMTQWNRISPIIEETTFYNEKEIQRKKVDYEMRYEEEVISHPGGVIVDGNNSSSPGPIIKLTAFIQPKTIRSSSNDDLRTDITFDSYDKTGNLLKSTASDGAVTCYLWSYNYQYPIAEIKNATFSEVETAAKTIFSVANADVLSALATPNETKLKDGSLQKALPNALVTTYTYKPLVGVTSMTDPIGVTTYYDYDDFGRLKETRIDDNGQKNLVESYQYHYKGNSIPGIPDSYEPGKEGSVFLHITTANSVGSDELTGYDFDNNSGWSAYQPIMKTYKTIDIGEQVWTKENLRLKYGFNYWMRHEQDTINKYIGPNIITPEELDVKFGSWTSLYEYSLFYRTQFTMYDKRGGIVQNDWDLPTANDFLQLFGMAPRLTGNVFNDIMTFLAVPQNEVPGHDPNYWKGYQNTSGFTMTPLGRKHSNQPWNPYYENGKYVSWFNYGKESGFRLKEPYAGMMLFSEENGPSINNMGSLYHMCQARYTRYKTAEELGYNMYVDMCEDAVVILPYIEETDLLELPKGLERGIALRYTNREEMKVYRKWSEIQTEALEIRSGIQGLQDIPVISFPPCGEILPDPYVKGKESTSFLKIETANSAWSDELTGYDYDNNNGWSAFLPIMKTYKTIEIDEYVWTQENLRLKYGYNKWMNHQQAVIDGELGDNTIQLEQFEQKYGSWVSLNPYSSFYRTQFTMYNERGGSVQNGWDLPNIEDFLQMFGQAPQVSDDVFTNIMTFLAVPQNEVPGYHTDYWKGYLNTSGFTMTPLGRRHSSQGPWTNPETGEKELWLNYGKESGFRMKNPQEGLLLFSEAGSRYINFNGKLYHLCQARYCRAKTDEELGYKMYIDEANDQIVMLPHTQVSSLPILPKGVERGVALRYTNRKRKKVLKKWSEIKAEAAIIKKAIGGVQ